MSGAGWFDKAACRGVPSAVFFPEIPTGDVRPHYWEQARAYCAACPVRVECLAFCLPFEDETGRRNGMWGGLTPRERDQLPRQPTRLVWRKR